MKPYFSVRIPWSDAPTVWHPTEKEGPFAVLTRGMFKTAEDAHTWAREHLGHNPVYTVVEYN